MFCPYYKNKEIFDGFNELIESFGGKPMTEDEFRSRALRSQRTGLDYYAMQTAYRVYNQNGGNFLDYAPNGEKSKLFEDLLEISSDRKRAIVVKALFYSNSFNNNVINWITKDGQLISAENTDINGEPLLSHFIKDKITNDIVDGFNISKQFYFATTDVFFGEDFQKALYDGKQVSSSEILNRINKLGLVAPSLSFISDVLSKHDVPVIFSNLENGKPMSTIHGESGVIICVDPRQIENLSLYTASKYFIHEVVHAATLSALKNPSSVQERKFKQVTEKTYEAFKDICKNLSYDEYDIESPFRIFKDKYEFAAIFATDINSKFLLYEKAIEYDKKHNNKFLLILKKFVNTFSRFLLDKNVFNLKEDQFKLYQLELDRFLVTGRSIRKGNISSKELFDIVYNNINKDVVNRQFGYESQRRLIEGIGYFTEHFVEQQDDEVNIKPGSALWKIRESIANALQTRLAAVKSSLVDDEVKFFTKNTLEPQLKQLRDPNINSIAILSQIINQAIPLLYQDVLNIMNVKETSASMYMYNMHDNFGTYAAIFNELSKNLQNDETLKEFQHAFKSIKNIDKLSAIKTINDFSEIVNSAARIARQGMDRMYYILMNNLKRDLGNMGEEMNFPDTLEFLNSLESIGFDTSYFMNTVGAKDGAKDDAIKTLVHLINVANRKAEKEVYDVSVDLLNAYSKLNVGESLLDLYEVDKNGITTGYLVRKKNYGVFYSEYRKFLEGLNEKYGLPKDNRKAPTSREQRILYNKEKNEWLGKNAIRRFKPEYYAAYAELSDDTMYQRQLILDAIFVLKQKAINTLLYGDHYYHYELLTPEEWNRLLLLYVHKRLLASFYDINGNKKVEVSDEYRWAEELQKLNKTLYSNVDDENKAYDAWKAERDRVIKNLVKKHTSGDRVFTEAIKKELDEWDARNSKRKFKVVDVNGVKKMKVFLQIDEELHQMYGEDYVEPVYDYKGDGGATYEANKKQMNEYLSIFRDYNTGEVNLDIMPASIKSKYAALLRENAQIVAMYKKNNPQTEKQRIKQGKSRTSLFNKYLMELPSSYYKRLYDDEEDDDLYDIEDDIDLPRWATKLVIRKGVDKDGISYKDKFTELVPGDGWVNTDHKDDLKDERFIQYESEGVSIVPADIDKYSNDKQWNKINNSPTLKNLYNVVESVMKRANSNMYNRIFQDDYLLPQITGSMFKYMKNKGLLGAAGQAFQYVKDEIGLSKLGVEQSAQFGQQIADLFLLANDLGEMMNQDGVVYGSRTTGTRADGRQFNIIPQYYTKKLEDTSQLSSDLIGIVTEYYRNSARFKYKSEIKDLAESILDMIEHRSFKKLNKSTGTVTEKRGVETNTYKAAKKFLEMNLYNMRSETTTLQLGSRELNVNKLQQLFTKATTALNLGMSPAVAATGLFTASYSHLINSLVGDRGYGTRELLAAGREVLYHTFLNGAGFNYISNLNTEDKLMALAEMFNISSQLERKTKHSNRNRLIRAFDHIVFGFLSSADFIIKSQIMVSELMSYRLVNGEFVSKEDIKNKHALDETPDALAEELKKWNEGVCLYSIFDIKDHKIVVDNRYKDAFEKIHDQVYFRIQKTAENADGMATETQKAAITTNFLGASVMMHRLYFPLMIQQRTSELTYDMDMNLMILGQYKTIILTLNLGRLFLKALKETKSFGSAKEQMTNRYNELFNNKSSLSEAMRSRARRQHIKKTFIEMTLFNFIISPLIGLLAAYADDDDQKDDLALQLAVYIARRTEWEIYTPYRYDDMLNNFKSVTAQTGTVDKIQAFVDSFGKWVSPRFSLFDTLFNLQLFNEYNPIVERGVYQDWYKIYRDLFKLTPMHNLYEQWYGAKNKRKYYENLIMKISK